MKEKKLAPNFKIPSSINKEFELKKNKNKFLVIYFYPRDNTPGCTNEAKDFFKLYKEFKKLNFEIFFDFQYYPLKFQRFRSLIF